LEREFGHAATPQYPRHVRFRLELAPTAAAAEDFHMDFSNLLDRVKGILLDPDTEWGMIAAEETTAAELYKRYIVILAAIPAVLGFIRSTVIGIDVPLLGSYRLGIGAGIAAMAIGYALGLVQIYLLAYIVDALATTFEGRSNFVQALKTVTYAFTASWVAGLGQILPLLAVVLALAGAGYSIYLLHMGLPRTMGCPPDKALAYTAVSVVAAIILNAAIGGAIAAVTGTGDSMGPTADSDTVHFDEKSRISTMDSHLKKLQQASDDAKATQRAGDAADE
jgi:Yip1 domain